MSTAVQVMMGVSLSACAGLRAWLPLFAVGIMGRADLVPLNPTFAFLESTPALVVFGVATVAELLGDKVIAVDHALDAVSTVARPLAGALLVASTLSRQDPLFAVVAGLILGGGTALTVHAGKAVTRAKASSVAFLHGGVGNALLSGTEDLLSVGGVLLALFLPPVAFFFAVLLLGSAALAVYLFYRTGRALWRLLFGPWEKPAEA